jgi:hypothetical protein
MHRQLRLIQTRRPGHQRSAGHPRSCPRRPKRTRSRAWEVGPVHGTGSDHDEPPKRLGWSVIDTSQFAGVPGVHDLGTLLGVTTGSLWLVILRAADRWVPNDDGVRDSSGSQARRSCARRTRRWFVARAERRCRAHHEPRVGSHRQRGHRARRGARDLPLTRSSALARASRMTFHPKAGPTHRSQT